MMNYLASGSATETGQQRCAELERFEEQHYAEIDYLDTLTYEAWAAASRLCCELRSAHRDLDAEERQEIRDLLTEALDLVPDNEMVTAAAA
jgi:hypothetical protein